MIHQVQVAVGCVQGGLGSQAELGIQAVHDKTQNEISVNLNKSAFGCQLF